MPTWTIQQAKSRLSEVLICAQEQGPQHITVNEEPVAVVLSQALYSHLTSNGQSLVELMRESPLFGVDAVTLARDGSLNRAVGPFDQN